jgi:hypothetical protein
MLDAIKEFQKDIREQIKKAWLDGYYTGADRAIDAAAEARSSMEAELCFGNSGTYLLILPKEDS